MSSRFFATGQSSSESETESSSSEDEPEVAPAARPSTGLAQFMLDTDSDEDVRREVKSAKDKRYEALTNVVANMKNHMKINDWPKIQEDFDELNDALKKIRKKDMVTGVAPPIPDIYLRAVVTLENFLADTLKNRPKLSKFNTNALNKMKLRVPKNSKLYVEELAALRATGKATLDDIPESSSEESEDESDDGFGGKAHDAAGDSDEESDSEEDRPASRWLKKGDTASKQKKDTREKRSRRSQLKPAEYVDDEAKEAPVDEDNDGFTTVTRKKSVPVINPEDMTEASVDQKLSEILTLRGRKGTNRHDQVLHLQALLKAAKTSKQTINLTLHLISAQFDCIPASKPAMPRDLWMKALENTKAVVKLAAPLYPMIRFADESDNLDSDIQFDQVASEKPPAAESAGQGEEGNDQPVLDGGESKPNGTAQAADQSEIIRGDLASTFERLDDELHQAYQSVDAYSPEYITRLRDETPLLELAALIQNYYERIAGLEAPESERAPLLLARAARIATRRIRHRYYTTEDLCSKIKELKKSQLINGDVSNSSEGQGKREGDRKAVAATPGQNLNGDLLKTGADGPTVDHKKDEVAKELDGEHEVEGPEDVSLRSLAVLVYRYGTERARNEVMLCQIYNEALEGRFYVARDMLLMSHLQESISSFDTGLQVLFNRAMTQLGLCAFRQGLIWETHACLQEICSPSFSGGGGPGRVKELLAQGVTSSRGYDKTPEMEKAERRRQIPYHMHIPLELIEAAHLVSAMLLEVPAMALSRSRGEVKRRPISKSFQYFLRNSMKQAFPGPPENIRDHVMAATRCLMKGNWSRAYEYVSAMRCWKSLDATDRAALLKRIEERIKVEGLRTFALSYSAYYESLGIEELSRMFDIGKDQVHSIISKMMMNGELSARWDQPTGCVVMRRVEPSRLQSLASGLAGKLANIAEMNERLAETRAGGSDEKKEWKQDRGRGGMRKEGGRSGRLNRVY